MKGNQPKTFSNALYDSVKENLKIVQGSPQLSLLSCYEINIFGRARALVDVARHANKLKRQYRCEIKLSRIFQGSKIHFENDEEYEMFVPEIKKAIEQYIIGNKIATFAG